MLKNRKFRKYILPGTALIASFYGSVIFAVGAILGYIGIDIFCKKYIDTKKIKCLEFSFRDWEIHIHHWITGGIIILSVYLLGWMSSVPVIVLGVLGGIVFHDIHTDKKLHEDDIAWYNVIYRK